MRLCVYWVLSAVCVSGLLARDFNNNGVSDIWEARYAVTAEALDEDPDGDGFTSRQESLLGTDPYLASSKLLLSILGPAELELSGLYAKRCQMESSGDLVMWAAMGDPFILWGSSLRLTMPAPGVYPAFVRCSVIGDLDEDGDGLSAWEEAQLGSGDDDAGNNGLPDEWELLHFGHQQVDPSADADGDGVSNLAEFEAQSVPVPDGPLITLEFPAEAVVLP